MNLRKRKETNLALEKENDDKAQANFGKTAEKSEAMVMKKDIGMLKAVSIIFSIIVGSGIFVSPVGVLKYTNSVGLSMIMWLIPGIFSLIGALVYAEIGVRIPKSGGEYIYVMETFGGLPAFLVMWVTFFIIGGVTCGANSLIFAKYILYPFYPDCVIPHHVVIIIALAGLALVGALNCYKVSWVTRVAIILSVAKFIALILIIGFGFYHIITGHTENFENSFENAHTSPGSLALAFYQGFWAFAGWSYLNFLVEEMENPSRDLPLAISIALILVTTLYILTNVAYLAVLSPFELLQPGSESAVVAIIFAKRAMPWFVMVMPVLVGASVFGSMNGIILSVSRLTYSGAREGHMPSVLAFIHHRNFTPIPAILVLILVSIGFQMYKDIFYLIDLAGFSMALIIALAVSTLIYLRVKEPHVKTDFQLPLALPISFLLCDLFILGLTIYQQPHESLLNVILILVAVPIYFIGVCWKHPRSIKSKMYSLTLFLQKSFAVVQPDLETKEELWEESTNKTISYENETVSESKAAEF
nr:cationic amino acid transporter [Hymenolepis microstoma]